MFLALPEFEGCRQAAVSELYVHLQSRLNSIYDGAVNRWVLSAKNEMRHRIDRNFALVTVFVLGIIVYGSLYPFHFRIPSDEFGALDALIRTWSRPPSSFGDLVANLLLYAPLGFFAVLAIPAATARARFSAAVVTGLSACVVIELTQFYDEGRITNASDVYLNTAGSAIGALAGLLNGVRHRHFLRDAEARPIPTLLILAWVGYDLFPYVPTIDLHKYWDSLKPVIVHPSLPIDSLLRHGVIWLAIAYLLEAIVRRRRSRLAFPIAVGLVLAAKVLILTQTLSVAEILGALLAFGMWLPLIDGAPRRRAAVVAFFFWCLLIAQELVPFTLSPVAGRLGLVPFLGLAQTTLDANIQFLLEKFFLYGTAIWLVVEAGSGLAPATLTIATLLMAIGLTNVYLLGRSLELTNVAIAVMIGGAFGLVERTRRRHPSGGARAIPGQDAPTDS
jgi:VanZ family protein